MIASHKPKVELQSVQRAVGGGCGPVQDRSSRGPAMRSVAQTDMRAQAVHSASVQEQRLLGSIMASLQGSQALN